MTRDIALQREINRELITHAVTAATGGVDVRLSSPEEYRVLRSKALAAMSKIDMKLKMHAALENIEAHYENKKDR